MRPLLASMFAILISVPAAHAQPVVLKVAHFLPVASAAHSKMIVPWCDKIESESQGQLKCQIYPAMQLGGNPSQLFGQARDGIADIVWTLPGYTPGRFPISEVFELPFVATTHQASSRALWDFTQQYAKSEFAGVKPIATWVNGPNYLHMRDKQVKTMEDLKGMKIRAPSRLSNELLTKLGASAMGMPLPQAVESYSKGVIDAALLPWEVIPGVKLHELSQYHAETAGPRMLATSTMIFVMNQKKYDSLSDELKKVIDANSGSDTSAWVAARFEEADKAGRKAAVDRGNTVYEISEDEMKRWTEATSSIRQEWIDAVGKKGADGQALYDAAISLVDKYSK